MNSQYPYP